MFHHIVKCVFCASAQRLCEWLSVEVWKKKLKKSEFLFSVFIRCALKVCVRKGLAWPSRALQLHDDGMDARLHAWDHHELSSYADTDNYPVKKNYCPFFLHYVKRVTNLFLENHPTTLVGPVNWHSTWFVYQIGKIACPFSCIWSPLRPVFHPALETFHLFW